MTDNPDDYWCMVPDLAQVPLPERMNLSIPMVMVSGFLVLVVVLNFLHSLIWQKLT